MTRDEALREMHELAEGLHGVWNRKTVDHIFDLAVEHGIFASKVHDEGLLSIEDSIYKCVEQ